MGGNSVNNMNQNSNRRLYVFILKDEPSKTLLPNIWRIKGKYIYLGKNSSVKNAKQMKTKADYDYMKENLQLKGSWQNSKGK